MRKCRCSFDNQIPDSFILFVEIILQIDYVFHQMFFFSVITTDFLHKLLSFNPPPRFFMFELIQKVIILTVLFAQQQFDFIPHNSNQASILMGFLNSSRAVCIASWRNRKFRLRVAWRIQLADRARLYLICCIS